MYSSLLPFCLSPWNTSAKLTGMLQLHSSFNKFVRHFVFGNGEDLLDVIQVIEGTKGMSTYRRRAAELSRTNSS
jgi:hypothetical protein